MRTVKRKKDVLSNVHNASKQLEMHSVGLAEILHILIISRTKLLRFTNLHDWFSLYISFITWGQSENTIRINKTNILIGINIKMKTQKNNEKLHSSGWS